MLQTAYFYSRTVPLTRRELDDFVVVEVNISVALGERQVRLYAGAKNFLDQDYAESYGIPQRGRFLYAGLRVSLP